MEIPPQSLSGALEKVSTFCSSLTGLIRSIIPVSNNPIYHSTWFFKLSYPCSRRSRMYTQAVPLDNHPMPPIPLIIAPHLILPHEQAGSTAPPPSLGFPIIQPRYLVESSSTQHPLSYYQVSTGTNSTQPDHLDTSGLANAHILPGLRRRRTNVVYHFQIVCILSYPLSAT